MSSDRTPFELNSSPAVQKLNHWFQAIVAIPTDHPEYLKLTSAFRNEMTTESREQWEVIHNVVGTAIGGNDREAIKVFAELQNFQEGGQITKNLLLTHTFATWLRDQLHDLIVSAPDTADLLKGELGHCRNRSSDSVLNIFDIRRFWDNVKVLVNRFIPPSIRNRSPIMEFFKDASNGLQLLKQHLQQGVEEQQAAVQQFEQSFEARGLSFPRNLDAVDHLARIVQIPLKAVQSGTYSLKDVHLEAKAFIEREQVKARIHAEAWQAVREERPQAKSVIEELQHLDPPLSEDDKSILRAIHCLTVDSPDAPIWDQIASKCGCSPSSIQRRGSKNKPLRLHELIETFGKGNAGVVLTEKGKRFAACLSSKR